MRPDLVSVLRDPVHGVVASLGPDASPAAREVLRKAGFRPLDDGRLTLDATPDGQNMFLHLRQTVAALRRTGTLVDAAPAFDSPDPTRTAVSSPALAAAGPDALAHAAPPVPARGFDVAVGRHPRLGIVARNPTGRPDIHAALVQAGFTPTGTELLALSDPGQGGDQRATATVARLRAQGMRVVADLAFEPLGPAYAPTDPFAAALREAVNPAPAPGSPANAVGGGAPDLRADALLHDRAAMSAQIASSLRAIEHQLRTDPGSVDLARIDAVITEAATVLAGAGRDLAAVAAHPAPTGAPVAASPRARAARATSRRLQTGAAVHAHSAARAAAGVPTLDPRPTRSARSSNSH